MFIEFGNVIFETTGITIAKHDGTDTFILNIQNHTMVSNKSYETKEERDEAYKFIKDCLRQCGDYIRVDK